MGGDGNGCGIGLLGVTSNKSVTLHACVFVFMTVSALSYSFSTDGCNSFGKKTSLYTCSVTMYSYYSTELQLFMFA